MTSVALVGGDGAGKTTAAELLVERFPARVEYLYMGTNASSSNVALPTTRIVYALKVRAERIRRREQGNHSDAPVSLHGIEHRRDRGGKIWATARLFNRIAEETMRQLVSWFHQARGAIVVYDRHFLFDFAAGGAQSTRLSERIHTWFLENVYPKPDLVLFLDAPAAVLVARKQEVPESYLEERRAALLARGDDMPQFVVIDAARPAEDVYRDVAGEVARAVAGRDGKRFKVSRRISRP